MKKNCHQNYAIAKAFGPAIFFILFVLLLPSTLVSCSNKKTPNLEGQWKCKEKKYRISITRVNESTYDIKWYDSANIEMEYQSGSYNYYPKSLKLTNRGAILQYSEDGRLYEVREGDFFAKE